MSRLDDDDRDPPAGAFGTGQAIGGGLRKAKQAVDRAEQVGQGMAAAAADVVSNPTRRLANAGGNLARGIGAATGITPTAQPVAFNPSPMQDLVADARPEVYGISRPTAPAAPMPASPAPAAAMPRPDFSRVAGRAATLPSAPARGAVGTGPVSPAVGAPAPLTPGAVNTFTGANGITRPVAPAAAVGGNAGVGAQAFGGAPMIARPAAPQPTPNLSVPGIPLPSVNTSRVAKTDAARDKLLRELDSQGFRNRIGGLNSRGARAMAGDLMRTQAQLIGDQGTLAGQAAGQTLDADTRAGIATQGQGAENQRALLGDQGATARTDMTLQSEDQRAAAAEAGETFRMLNRPQLEVGADDSLLQVTGGQAKTVRDEQGNPIKRPAAQLTPDQVLAGYADELATRLDALQGLPLNLQDPTRVLAEMEASPLGQARKALFEGAAKKPRAPAPGTVADGYRFQGGDPADPASWRKVE